MSWTRAEQREAACPAHTEGEDGGRDDERAEAAGAASPTPVRATSSTRAKQREAACAAQARTAAEMMRRLKLRAAANITPVRAMSCARAEQREVACAAQAEGESSSQDDERAEAPGGGESVTPVRATS